MTPATDANARLPAGYWRWIGSLLVFQVVLGEVCLFLLIERPRGGLIEALAVGVLLSQGTLLGIWISLLGRAAPWRLVVFTIVFVLSVPLAYWSDPRAYFWEYALVVCAQPIVTGLLLLILRGAGLEVTRPGAPLPISQNRRLQFSLQSMLACTTIVAIVLGSWQLFFAKSPDSWAWTGLTLAWASVAPLALWAALGSQRAATRVLLLLLVALAAFAVSRMVVPLGMAAAVSGFFMFEILLTAVFLLVLRAVGYRLAWRRYGKQIESSPSVEASDEPA